MDLNKYLRDVPDFPKPGILFKDITPLLASPLAQTRAQAIGLFQAIGPKDLPAPPEDAAALTAWADEAAKSLFPPIRNLNDAIVQLQPGRERDAVAAAGLTALQDSSIVDPWVGKAKDGATARGVRVVTVPAALKPLAIPAGAVITSINGAGVRDAASLLATLTQLRQAGKPPRKLMVELLVDGAPRAIEYRVL